jgi:DNA-binding transcriptional LysR family regulator
MRPMQISAYIDAVLHGNGPAPVLDLRALAEYVVVADQQHMTRAAELLGVPQPTLSRRIARLERSLGLPLLRRHGRRVETTRQGRTLADVARRALQDVNRVLTELSTAHDAHRGLVTLAFLHTLGPSAVPAVIGEFGQTFPDVRFQLVQEGHDEVVDRLRAGDVDIALTAPLPTGPEVASFSLIEQRLCAVVPRDHPLASRKALTLAALAGESFVGFKPGYGLRRITDTWCR